MHVHWNFPNSFPVNKQKRLYVVCYRLKSILPILFLSWNWKRAFEKDNFANFCALKWFKISSLKHKQNYTLFFITCISATTEYTEFNHILAKCNGAEILISISPVHSAFRQNSITNSDGQIATQCHYEPQCSIVLPVSDTIHIRHLLYPADQGAAILSFMQTSSNFDPSWC